MLSLTLPNLFASFFFFFSSRRRHTRWPRDWSSDVCSSDLTERATTRTIRSPRKPSTPRYARRTHACRSEERRVGKECRSRWWPYDEKKKEEEAKEEEDVKKKTRCDHTESDGMYKSQ